MPVCELCENNVRQVFRCKECSIKFCSKCGDEDRDLCEDCLEYEATFKSGMTGGMGGFED